MRHISQILPAVLAQIEENMNGTGNGSSVADDLTHPSLPPVSKHNNGGKGEASYEILHG
jgi:hypothetical protein